MHAYHLYALALHQMPHDLWLSREQGEELCGRCAWHLAMLIYHEKIATESFGTMIGWLRIASAAQVAEATTLFQTLTHDKSIVQ